jgi:hypothetical protein
MIIKDVLTNKNYSKEEFLTLVPKGWKNIISKLVDEMFQLGWNGEFVQIKEKFGTLRFYLNKPVPISIEILIEQAEIETKKHCRVCGSTQSVQGNYDSGFFAYLCDKHRK